MPIPDRPPVEFKPILEDFPEEARLIGVYIANWTTLEFMLAADLALIAGTTNELVFPMVYGIDSSRARLSAMSAGFERLLVPGGFRDKMLAALADAQKLLTVRNKYAHALFSQTSSATTNLPELHITRLNPPRDEIVKAHDLRHLLSEQKKFSARMFELRLEYMKSLPPGHPLAEFARAARPDSATGPIDPSPP